MIRLKKILCPTDFSEHSRSSLVYACELALKFGAELHLLHIMQDLVTIVPEAGMSFVPPGDYLEQMKISATQALEKVPGEAFHGPTVRAVRTGPPFVEIVRYAREEEIDLIVLSTHGRSGLAHVLLGSVAEKVVRKAPCPVLTIRPHGEEFHQP